VTGAPGGLAELRPWNRPAIFHRPAARRRRRVRGYDGGPPLIARPARAPEAAHALHEEVLAGRIDAVAVGAVVEAAGLPRRRTAWPKDLTDHEVEVLRMLARGLSNRAIAEELVLSPRTVQHHLASVYDKIDLRTRAGAAVFAIEQGLVLPDSGI
jgi:DNA-binding NarL/FixJ family response regulator